ncbi:MAG: response regulator transcription factor [Planctomycetaceae bacterium]
MSRTLNPDLLLVSDECFRADCRELSDYLPLRMQKTKLALFADRLSDRERMQASEMHASAFVSRKESLASLLSALNGALEGKLYVSPQFRDRLEIDPSGRLRITTEVTFRKLSNLQLQVLLHLAEGMRVKDVAEKMELSLKAIESHKYRIMRALGVNDRLGLCRLAIREGLLEA